jgi:hypothetical protein
MMYGCYLDESFDMKQSGFYAVGGFIAQGVPVFELDHNWTKLLKRHGLKYFKASECESGKKEFAKFVANPGHITAAERAKLDSISHEFCRLIGNPVKYDPRNYLCVMGVAVRQKDFYALGKDPKARAILGASPNRLAYDLAMVQGAWAMKTLGSGKPDHCCSYICDEDEEHKDEAPKAYGNLKKANPEAAKYMSTFSTEDEKTCVPLQAADAAVYEIRKALKFSVKDFETRLRQQFSILADQRVVFYVAYMNRKQLKWIVANHKPGEPFKLDQLMKYKPKKNIDTLTT